MNMRPALLAREFLDQHPEGCEHFENLTHGDAMAVCRALVWAEKALREVRDLRMGPGTDGVVGDYIEDVRKISGDALTCIGADHADKERST